MIWFIRALFILLLVRTVLRLLFPQRPPAARGPARGPSGRRAPEVAGGELVRDPQCGTYVPKTRAITVGTGDEILYFCSATCRDAWGRVRKGTGETG